MDAVNTNLVTNLDTTGAHEALADLENVLNATRNLDVQSEVSYDDNDGNDSLSLIHDASSAGGSQMVTRRQRRVARSRPTVSASRTGPRVGGVKSGIAWTGGSFIDLSRNPKTIKAYRPTEFKFLAKVEESSTEGLAP